MILYFNDNATKFLVSYEAIVTYKLRIKITIFAISNQTKINQIKLKLNIDTTNIMCFYTDIAAVDVHYHSCYQIVVSTKFTYDSVIDGKDYKNIKGFIIDKYTKHSCTAPIGSFLVYYIESKSFLGRQLKKVLENKIFIDIETILSKNKLMYIRNSS